VLALLLYLPGFFTLPPTDRDEARFAEASRQMLQSGNLVDIRFQDQPRYQKPIGIYWLQSGAAFLAGRPADAIWPYRIPSIIGAILALNFLLRLGERLFDRRSGLIAAVLLGSCILLSVEARIATTDACLLAASLAAFEALAAAYLGPINRMLAMQFWIALGASILLKGPVLALILAITIVTLVITDRRIAWLARLQPLLGVPLAALIVAPWLIAIAFASHGAFYHASLGNDFFSKITSAQELHGFPPAFYLAALAVTFWPSGLIAVAALPAVWQRRKLPVYRFLLAWLIPAWIVMEAVPTKLVHYVLPLYPALALLAASIFADRSLSLAPVWRHWLGKAAIALWLIVSGVGVAILLLGGWRMTGSIQPIDLLAGVVLAASTAGALWLLLRDQREAALGMFVVVSLVLQTGLFGMLLPRLDSLWLSRQAEKLVASASPCSQPLVISSGYEEPSLVFLLGQQTALLGPEDAAHNLLDRHGRSCTLALISAENDQRFRDSLGGAMLQTLGQIEGINYNIGRSQHLTLYALP
jgi:4-amino-4-deoxy-L-arabinose transferase-like glycosyltransferase